jgi:hypothetical protein
MPENLDAVNVIASRQLEVIETLATVKVAVTTSLPKIEEHLAKLNGKVAKHEEYIVGKLAIEKASKGWMDRLMPVIYGIGVLIGALLLINGKEIVHALH